MIKIAELNKPLGWVLLLATLGTYVYLESKADAVDGLASILYSLYYIVLFPILVIGISVGLHRYERFSNAGFKVGAFLLLTVLLYTLWMGPSYWPFSLTIATIAGGLLFSLIKLSDSTARFVFVLVGMVITTLIFVAVSAF